VVPSNNACANRQHGTACNARPDPVCSELPSLPAPDRATGATSGLTGFSVSSIGLDCGTLLIVRVLAIPVLTVVSAAALATVCISIVEARAPTAAKPTAIAWAGRVFTSQQEFAAWLDRRGGTYAAWRERHPGAAPWEVTAVATRRAGGRNAPERASTPAAAPEGPSATIEGITAAAVMIAFLISAGGLRRLGSRRRIRQPSFAAAGHALAGAGTLAAATATRARHVALPRAAIVRPRSQRAVVGATALPRSEVQAPPFPDIVRHVRSRAAESLAARRERLASMLRRNGGHGGVGFYLVGISVSVATGLVVGALL
jgi:hypothetical protein